MKRNQFTFYRSYYEAIKVLPKKEQTAVMLAIAAYALDDEEPKLEGTSAAIFLLVRPTLDAGRKKAIGGSNGTSKKDKDKIEGRTQEEADNEKEKEGEKENECYKKNTRFRAPSSEEVYAYCQEHGYSVDPEHFVAYYAARGWSYGKGIPMKDWKAAVRTWVKNQPASSMALSVPQRKKFQEVEIDGELCVVEVAE